MAGSVPRSYGLHPNRRQFLLGALAIGVSAPLLSACGDDEPTPEATTTPEVIQNMTFLSIIPAVNLSNAAELLADANGFFTKRGLNVTIQVTQGSAPALGQIAAGTALLARLGDIEIMTAGAQGVPLVNVGTVDKAGALRFMSSKRRPLTKPEDFRGATMGLPSAGGTSEQTLDLVLASAGIPKEQVKRQVVGLTPAIFDLVKQAKIDGYIVSLDTSLTLLKQEPDAIAFVPSSVIAAGRQAYTTSKAQTEAPATQDQLRRFLLAVSDSIRFMIDDQKNGFKETMRIIATKYDLPAFQNPDVAVQALTIYVASWTADGLDQIVRTNRQSWRNAYNELVESGIVAAGKDPNAWLSDEFAPKAG